MNTSDLINAVAEKTGLTKADAKAAVDAALKTIASTVNGGDKVQLTGFGSFSLVERPARTGRNPRTGEPTQIAASRGLGFKASKTALSG